MKTSIKGVVRAGAWAAAWLFRLPAMAATLLMELVFSPRGLGLGCLAIAAVFVVGPWLRPPVSRDLRGTHIPLGLWEGSRLSADEVVQPERPWRWDSVGAPLLIVIALGAIGVLVRPQSLSAFFAPLVVLGLAANAMTLLNHPLTVDQLDDELLQRLRIRRILYSENDQLLAANSRPRVSRPGAEDSLVDELPAEAAESARGWRFLVFGPWLAGFSLLVVLAATPGGWSRRLLRAGACLALGALLAGAVTARRCHAEWLWNRAVRLEQAHRFDEAEQALEQMVTRMPELGQRPQSWELQGKIDLRRGESTVFSRYFLARQHFVAQELDSARALAAELLDRAPDVLAVRALASQVESELGLRKLVKANSAGSQEHWLAACRAASWRVECQIGLAVAVGRSAKGRPELVDLELLPGLDRIGDRVLRSDLAAMVGDAYFEAGDFAAARRHYEMAKEAFDLPKYVNVHVQERLLGM